MENFIVGHTLDDVMHIVFTDILSNGQDTYPSKGYCKEIIGELIEIDNPRSRLSRTEIKGTPFSCLGELCWYLSQSNQLDYIEYYIPEYKLSADDGIIFGGYGPRMFCWNSFDQISKVRQILEKKDSRRAVIQLFDLRDLYGEHKDIPCTCFLQFFRRNDKLHMITYMRSNDLYKGFPHDIFCFTMLQEILARSLSLDLGVYKHFVGSLHLYEENFDSAKRYLNEGYQSTKNVMPEMPIGDPWENIQILLRNEEEIRLRDGLVDNLDELHPYWADLIRLLQIFKMWKKKDIIQILKLKEELSTSYYKAFIEKKLLSINIS